MKRFIVFITVLFFANLLSGQNQNISQGFVFDGEPYLSIDPDNSQHMVVAWMSWTLFSDIVIKTKVTLDGGNSWSDAVALQHVNSEFKSADASIEFDSNGNVFITYIDFSGYDVIPFDGGIYISKSTDGGFSWSTPVEVINNDADPGKRAIDRPWISIDRSGGPNNGNIYVTSMNAKEATIGSNPYLTLSADGGNSFEPWRYLDTTDWLAGFIVSQPMPTPALSSTGVFHAVYPSFVLSQSLMGQFIIASSVDGGNSLTHHSVLTSETDANDPLAKRGYLLRTDPTNDEHLVFIYLDKPITDLDVYMTESFNEGVTWSEGIRINDDPIGNKRMQDLLWADFDDDGDLVISWRDRRNGNDSTYTTASEIWGAVRLKNGDAFLPNFQITDELVPYDSILGFSGNDFMCIKLANDTLNAVWGDARNGKLNIWYQRSSLDGVIISVKQIASESYPVVNVFPNPVKSELTVKGFNLEKVIINNQKGKEIAVFQNNRNAENWKLNLSAFSKGIYILKIITKEGTVSKKIIKE